MTKDNQMHIVCSAAITLLAGSKKAFEIGMSIELNDRKKFNTPLKHCCEDMLANVAGIAVGLLIKKLITL